ncbi:MAG: hypothetical protein FWD35_03465 [Oscillospiraceae bacterium]|nr:hypothetical protein [Oscillospiraceae bacterium]
MKLTSTPLKSYNAPKIPTLAQAREDKAFLKTMPRRWRKSAAVLACAAMTGSMVGSMAFGGAGAAAQGQSANEPIVGTITRSAERVRCFCCSRQVLQNVTRRAVGRGDAEQITVRRVPAKRDNTCNRSFSQESWKSADAQGIELTAHYGGTGFASYVVYFTEQEAINYIRSRLEEKGLRFRTERWNRNAPLAEPPDFTAEFSRADKCGICGDWWEANGDNLENITPQELQRIANNCMWLSRVQCNQGKITRNVTAVPVLYDRWHDVGIAVRRGDFGVVTNAEAATELENLAQENKLWDATFGVFTTRIEVDVGNMMTSGQINLINPNEQTQELITRLKATARPQLEARLDTQIDAFLERLKKFHCLSIFDGDCYCYHGDYGGSGFASYVVYLTEQEMLSVLHAQLSEAGLDYECGTLSDAISDFWDIFEPYDGKEEVSQDEHDEIKNEFTEMVKNYIEMIQQGRTDT